MLTKEYRILLPLTVEEYRIAQLYMIQKKSRLESSGTSSGVEIITNEPYECGPGGSGQYTIKIYHISSRIPAWIRSVLPSGALDAHEESWNAYPFTKTRYSCQIMDRFHVEVETRYFDDCGTQDNVFNLSEEELRNREVDIMDFVNDQVSDYSADEDPKLFRSRKTGRGQLTENWLEDCKRAGHPIMCAYKICRVEFRYWGLQTRAERWIHDLALRKTMLHAHRQAWVWQDEWIDLTMADIRRLEEETAHYLSSVMLREEKKEERNDRKTSKRALNSSEEREKRKLNSEAKLLLETIPRCNIEPHSSDDTSFTGEAGTSEEDDVCLSLSRSRLKDSSNFGDDSPQDGDSNSEDIFFDCCDQPNFSLQKIANKKPALIRWSSELLLEAGDEDELPLAHPNSALLILVFHGDIFPENPADAKTTDAMTLNLTLEHIVKNHYPQLKGRFRVLQISCGKELASTFTQLTSISSHFNVFHPSFALLLSTHRQAFQQAIKNTISSANEVLNNFLQSDDGSNFKKAEVFAVGDYVGGLLMYEAMTKYPATTPASTEHGQVSRNFSSIYNRSANHSRERDVSSCSLFEYNIDVETTEPSVPENHSLSNFNNRVEDCHTSINTILPPLHKNFMQIVSSKSKISPTRNLSAPPSAGFRLPTPSARLSTSSNEANDWPSAIQSEILSFKPNSAFLLGCPLALVLMQRKLARKDIPELECEQLFNIYYPLDLCAGRLEPVLNEQLAALPPLSVPRYQCNRPTGGSGRQFFFDNALETPMLWGSRRVDHELYCPYDMTSLSFSALPNILHASYWESKDVGEFILRQFVRADNTNSQSAPNSAFVASAKNLLMDCDIPSKLWNRRRTKFKIANLTANHRANDAIMVEGAIGLRDVINARFCYGPMDLVALSLENILVYVRPMNGKWVLNSKEMTDTHGRVAVRLNLMLPVGVHEIRMIVQGDRSYLNLYVAVVPSGTECVIFSIDGSLTGSVSVTGRDPRVKPGAVDVVRYWQQQGYLIIYVTARPDMQQRLVAHWLMRHNFPYGLLYFTPSISTDPLKQKMQLLRQLIDQNLQIHAAYGSAKDVHVYASVGVESDRIFRIGSSKKRCYVCMPVEDGYAHHLHSIHSGEVKIARPAKCGVVSDTVARSLTPMTSEIEQQRNFMYRNESFAPRSGKYSNYHSGNKKHSQISISTR